MEEENDIYRVAARVKNLARIAVDANLTPSGEGLCNSYIHVLMSLYSFAEKLEEPLKSELIRLVKENEDMPARVIEFNKRNFKKTS